MTTTSTANEVFVNGTSVATGSYEWAWIDANPRIGYRSSTSSFQGYLAEWHYISGSVKSVSDFTETDDNGVLRPIEYEGSYGTNGYYLKFDPSLTNGILHDSSGQGNHFDSSTGFTTSGTGTDVMSDTPTTNWATLNPLHDGAQVGPEDGNLKFAWSSTGNYHQVGTATIGMPGDGKWYWEVTKLSTRSDSESIGILREDGGVGGGMRDGQSGTPSYSYEVNGEKNKNASGSSYGATYAQNDVIGVAVDLTPGGTSGTITFYKNGTSQGVAFSDIDTSYTWLPAVDGYGQSPPSEYTLNFGQRPFEYTPPTGFEALNTSNLPAPTVKDGSKNFSANTWTGNGTTNNALTGFGHQPDFVWGKARNQAYAHALFDSVRGGGYRVYNNGSTPPAQDYNAEYIKSFDSDGITLGSDANLNGNNVTTVGWSWKGGGTVSADNNTDGTITTTVSANPTGGFSVIKYTSNGTSGATNGHGLGNAPAFFIVKSIDSTDHYAVYHQSLGNGKALLLNSSNTPYTDTAFWNDTSPTNTVITLGNETSTNTSDGDDYICWAWAEVEGFSKFGSYTGNGSTDGVFIYTGFKVAWWLVKRTDSTEYWYIRDTTRDDTNPISIALNPNSSDVEGSYGSFDFLSNGIKIRESGTGSNTSGGTYIYAAFASHPFGGSGVSPATAR